MAFYGKPFGDPANRLATDIALGQITGKAQTGGYSNSHMERGHEQEPIARALYEAQTFTTVTNGGFWCNDEFGASPDGMCGDGVIEIKSVIPSTHMATITKGTIDSAYKWQCCSNLAYTKSKWLDYASYCADFPPNKRLFIRRLWLDEIQEDIKKMDSRIKLFLALVAFKKKAIEEGQYVVGMRG